MICCPKYNPNTDIKAVSPNGALDLKSAFANNAIPANLNVKEGRYNNIDDPSSIAGRVKDTIDAEVINRSIRDYKAPAMDEGSSILL